MAPVWLAAPLAVGSPGDLPQQQVSFSMQLDWGQAEQDDIGEDK